MRFWVKGQLCKYFWESSLLDWSASTHIKPCWMPVCWSNVALIYLFNTSMIEGLFGQVQHAGQGRNSCHWIKRGGDKERQMREGRWGLLVWAAAMSCTSPINLCPREKQQLAFAFRLLTVSPIWCFSPHRSVYFQAWTYSVVIISWSYTLAVRGDHSWPTLKSLS